MKTKDSERSIKAVFIGMILMRSIVHISWEREAGVEILSSLTTESIPAHMHHPELFRNAVGESGDLTLRARPYKDPDNRSIRRFSIVQPTLSQREGL
ncbi:hypothetical protein V2G26_009350 [Clonostachys chloroleuca]